jgi:hypothetical protein
LTTLAFTEHTVWYMVSDDSGRIESPPGYTGDPIHYQTPEDAFDDIRSNHYSGALGTLYVIKVDISPIATATRGWELIKKEKTV